MRAQGGKLVVEHRSAEEVTSMTIRLILWIVVIACIGFLLVDRNLDAPLGVTISGTVLGAGLGLILAIIFSRRTRRKREPKSDLRRY